MPRTSMRDAVAILDLLESIGAEPIVGGGWGIDALLGTENREHADLDVIITAPSEAASIEALEAGGFAITTDWRPIRVALTHPDGPEVDLHPVTTRMDGTRIQQGFDGATFEYPADDITTGVIGGRTVRCLSAGLQMRFHDGYEPTARDVDDCARLSEATGLPFPASMIGHVGSRGPIERRPT